MIIKLSRLKDMNLREERTQSASRRDAKWPKPNASASKFKVLETKTLKDLREKHKFQTKNQELERPGTSQQHWTLKQWTEITSDNSSPCIRISLWTWTKSVRLPYTLSSECSRKWETAAKTEEATSIQHRGERQREGSQGKLWDHAAGLEMKTRRLQSDF